MVEPPARVAVTALDWGQYLSPGPSLGGPPHVVASDLRGITTIASVGGLQIMLVRSSPGITTVIGERGVLLGTLGLLGPPVMALESGKGKIK